MSWLRTFITICAAILALVLVALVLLVSFVDLGLSANGIAAMFIGTLLTIVVAMVLMGLLFMSERGGYDVSVHEAGAREGPAARRSENEIRADQSNAGADGAGAPDTSRNAGPDCPSSPLFRKKR